MMVVYSLWRSQNKWTNFEYYVAIRQYNIQLFCYKYYKYPNSPTLPIITSLACVGRMGQKLDIWYISYNTNKLFITLYYKNKITYYQINIKQTKNRYGDI